MGLLSPHKHVRLEVHSCRLVLHCGIVLTPLLGLGEDFGLHDRLKLGDGSMASWHYSLIRVVDKGLISLFDDPMQLCHLFDMIDRI